MANSLCKSTVLKTYQEIISDVIQNVKDHFLEDGIDENVLQELKTLWESKLAATKAVQESKDSENSTINKVCNSQQPQLVGQVPPNNHNSQEIAFSEWKKVPVQLTIPSPPGCSNVEPRVLGIEVPEVFLQGHHLKSILTGPIISATLNLPLEAAKIFLQDQVNNAFSKHQQSTYFSTVIQSDGANDHVLRSSIKFRKKCHEKNILQQYDGMHSSSEDDLDDDEEESVDEEDVEDVVAQEVTEEDPLNSGDDESDAEGTDETFETDNVIVCQFDKITRARNRWKFHFKDGIMNLNGEDYVFQKANGDAEW
ncbi:hypothetical protein ABEB36_010865 [Hypothenemus hampei]|uniref:Transcription initiation factor IIA subunit 1 n=1 Tax=Hypothenemus hampei TaxID=57062 RepID=A0ABD1EG28_HYPHA